MQISCKEKFNRFFPALTGFVCFLSGFAGATLIIGLIATTKYEALKASPVTAMEMRENSLLSLLAFESQIIKLQTGQIESQDFKLIQKMAYHIGGDLDILKSELKDKTKSQGNQ